tara:strand:- start:10 stop:558 length:549 start_codon:yes stop_codon:yes gene_type:complete
MRNKMEVVGYKNLPVEGQIMIHTRGDMKSVAKHITQFTRLNYLWGKLGDAWEIIELENMNANEQKALVVFLWYAILGKIPEMIKLHQKIMEKNMVDLEKVMENEKSYSIDGIETKHEEAVRLVGNGQKEIYDFRKDCLENTIEYLKLPYYQETLELFMDVNKEKVKWMKPLFEKFVEKYTKE